MLDASEDQNDQKAESDPAKKRAVPAAASGESSEDTDRSGADSTGLADVMQELELLTKGGAGGAQPLEGQADGVGGAGGAADEEVPSPGARMDEDLGAPLAPLEELGEHTGPTFQDLGQHQPVENAGPPQDLAKAGLVAEGSQGAPIDGPNAEVNTLARPDDQLMATGGGADLENSVTNKELKMATEQSSL